MMEDVVSDDCGFLNSVVLETIKSRTVLRQRNALWPALQKFKNTPGQVLFVPINDSLHWSMVALLHTHTDAFFAIHYNSLQGTHVGVAATKLEERWT
jgi:hypothetical protein